MPDAPLRAALRRIEGRANDKPALIGISGIDASGKSTVAAALAGGLREQGLACALVSIDWFHHPAPLRFLPPDRAQEPAASHARWFFDHAFRWEDLFELVIDPLTRHGSCDSTVGVHDMKTDALTPTRIEHRGVRAIILEGIFIFRREFRERFDLRVWIDCPFDLALRRALSRNQEGLPTETIRRDYDRVYFPAQRHHLERDHPVEHAHLVVPSAPDR